MSNKVQAKAQGSETSVFHHGLIKLLVLEEFKKLNRDWASFLFLSRYEVGSVTPKNISKPKITSSLVVLEEINEERGQPIVEPMDIEVEPMLETDIPQPSSASQKKKISKHSSRRITMSQTLAKGNLEDILQEIDIE